MNVEFSSARLYPKLNQDGSGISDNLPHHEVDITGISDNLPYYDVDLGSGSSNKLPHHEVNIAKKPMPCQECRSRELRKTNEIVIHCSPWCSYVCIFIKCFVFIACVAVIAYFVNVKLIEKRDDCNPTVTDNSVLLKILVKDDWYVFFYKGYEWPVPYDTDYIGTANNTAVPGFVSDDLEHMSIDEEKNTCDVGLVLFNVFYFTGIFGIMLFRLLYKILR